MTDLAFGDHDHAACIQGTVRDVEARCAEERLQLTPVRRRVLEILLERHKALGAYEILDVLRAEGLGSQPPVVYRALDFLVTHGFAHKIEKLNAFVACTHPGEDHAPAFLICRGCNGVAEAQGARVALGDEARASGFAVETMVIECEGLCPACQEAA
ncbi:transcriptional repressor [Marivita hallyeonensis]|uniref:Fur family transcriptional regulator, zinc uptake regulator n=1 Tax=Marivita hallyeonensis TaxID=996342 RepID=A0A1M5TJ25_9RHOB|nr:transcriptional repressor [Marivita hallyeonensis]SHH50704.1 Fur family transcriptional regulator, zinc uptake regulator [Marivita hallyeonensis]